MTVTRQTDERKKTTFFINRLQLEVFKHVLNTDLILRCNLIPNQLICRNYSKSITMDQSLRSLDRDYAEI